MADIQVTQEVVVELNNFHNIDLFQRGYYQLRIHVENPTKLSSIIECELAEENEASKAAPCLFKAFVDKHSHSGISKTFEVYYKHEEVPIKDKFVFKVHMLVDGSKLESQIPRKLDIVIDLYFVECSRRYPATPKSLELASSQAIILHLPFGKTFHAYRPVLFDYFHLGAVTFTVHSCLTAFRQPWSASLKAVHPIWSGKSGNVRQYCYNALFGKSSQMAPTQKLDNRQKSNASFLHRKLCLQLLRLYEQLLTYYHSAISCLPDYAQMRLSKVDINGKLDVLNTEFDLLATAEENYTRMGDDLYLLSTELSMLWLQFIEQFSFDDSLLEHLINEHHILRKNHMKEAFFTEEHPWEALCTSLELSTSQQTKMSNAVKNSLYYQLIPPVNLECNSLDGDNTTMPIIFEDKYIPGKKVGQDLKRGSSFSMTVEESIVGDDFVDMDVSIEDSAGHVTKLQTSGDEKDENDDDDNDDNGFTVDESCLEPYDKSRTDSLLRKSEMIKKFQTGSDQWELSREKLSHAKNVKETDLTGSEYSSKTEHCHKELTSTTSNSGRNGTGSPLKELKSPKFPNKETAVFYTSFDDDDSSASNRSKLPSVGEDALTLEELDIDNETAKDKQKLDLPKKYLKNSKLAIGEPPSPSDPPKPKLWSCFPALKTGSSKRNSYKMVMQSPPYMPAPKDSSTRFQRAKDTLEATVCNLPGHRYSHLTEATTVRPYFSERIVATTENVHLVVCVHGLDGNSGDLRLVKCYLEMALPRSNFDFLMSEVNQDDTFCDIDEMTSRLVQEILRHIEEQNIEVVKLSFVGHSLGNIIIRNAVANSSLFEYRNKLHTFLSLSGPHLGMQFHTSNLVSTGMWLMQKWKKNGSLVQLALNDSSDPRDTFMYRLSLTNGFQYFKNVLLVSSVQDHYVPFHSARVEMSKQVVKDHSEGSRVYKEMLDNIMNPLMVQEEININRYSVYHPMSSSANTFIGRAAHIAMLDSELFLEKFILITASKYFA